MFMIYDDRAIYKGNKEIITKKVYRTKTGSIIDPDVVMLYCKTMGSDTYQERGIYFKDIPIEELDDYYRVHYRAAYKGYDVRMDCISYERREIQIQTGDSRGTPRKDEFERLGFKVNNFERGAIYTGVVPLDSLEKITRKSYSYKTKERQQKIVTKEEFWFEVMEAKSFLEETRQR